MKDLYFLLTLTCQYIYVYLLTLTCQYIYVCLLTLTYHVFLLTLICIFYRQSRIQLIHWRSIEGTVNPASCSML